ncbi:hypothetical protein AA313_de0200345 [Arthrobotrys entomopaga]|nr:hypothetical protein AA313_de0200345 [Arthrobotrys entomopaga]
MAENVPITPSQKSTKQKSLVEDPESSAGVLQELDLHPKASKDLSMAKLSSTTVTSTSQSRASQILKDQIEGETTQLFQKKLAIDTADKEAEDPKLGKPGPSKFSATDSPASKKVLAQVSAAKNERTDLSFQGRVSASTDAAAANDSDAQKLHDEIEAEREMLIKHYMRCGLSAEEARDNIMPWYLGPNKYCGPEFEAAKEKYRQKFRDAGYSEEHVRTMKIPNAMLGGADFRVPNEREREEIRAIKLEGEKQWDEIYYKRRLPKTHEHQSKD